MSGYYPAVELLPPSLINVIECGNRITSRLMRENGINGECSEKKKICGGFFFSFGCNNSSTHNPAVFFRQEVGIQRKAVLSDTDGGQPLEPCKKMRYIIISLVIILLVMVILPVFALE